MFFIICGYIFYSNKGIPESIKKYCIISLIAAFILTGIYLYFEFSPFISEISSYMLTEYSALSSLSPPDLTLELTGFFVLRHLAACCWMIAILGLASRFLNFNNRFLAYTSEAVFPFYILHMTIIYLIGLFTIQWNTGIVIKYIIIAISSFVITMLIYKFFVRRISVLRFLFGMKIKK
jgi:glucan biosynthesis protein C